MFFLVNDCIIPKLISSSGGWNKVFQLIYLGSVSLDPWVKVGLKRTIGLIMFLVIYITNMHTYL